MLNYCYTKTVFNNNTKKYNNNNNNIIIIIITRLPYIGIYFFSPSVLVTV